MQNIILHKLFDKLRGKTFAVTYSNGDTKIYGTNRDLQAAFRLILNKDFSLREILKDPEVRFGEAYMDKKFEFEGDLRDGFAVLIENGDFLTGNKGPAVRMHRFLKRQRRKSRRQKIKDLQCHYDLGTPFYRTWLDETLTYSCAYFRNPQDNLVQAQNQKTGHILRKLQLQQGQTLLDIGCGWGNLIVRAAEDYGVRALGITLSEEQAREARLRILSAGLQDRVEVRVIDFCHLAREAPVFDRIVSVGMFEHVGRHNIPLYFDCLNKMLSSGGLSLLQTITQPVERPTNPWIEKYIFPYGYVPSLRETVWEIGEKSFNIIDIESLRRHYALTLDRWSENFDSVNKEITAMYGERFFRMWRLYLYSCAAFFRYSWLDLHQLILSKGPVNNLPLTREHLYHKLQRGYNKSK